MKMNDKTYDIIKWIAQYFLPAVGTLYFALANIWGFGQIIILSAATPKRIDFIRTKV